MKVNFISESEFLGAKDHGVHTAYLNLARELQRDGVTLEKNSFGASTVTHINTIGPFALYKLLLSHPNVTSAHVIPDSFVGSLKFAEKWKKLAEIYLKFFYNQSDMVLAVSPMVKTQLEKMGVKKRIEILPNTVNEESFHPDESLRTKGREFLQLPDKKFVAVGVGQIQPRKGIADFIEVAKNLPDVQFIWIGGKPFKSLTEDVQVDLSKLPANVKIVGPVEYVTMPQLYNAADVFFFPSYQENAPMAIIEAAACGLPLVLRRLPEYRTLYHDDYLACGSVQEFARTIQELKENRRFYEKQLKKSIEFAQKFSSREIGKKLIHYYTLVAK